MNNAVQKSRKVRLPLRILHWLTAIAITFAWIFVYSKGLFAKGSPERAFLAGAHVFVGLTVLALWPLRVAARRLWALPAIEPSPPLWQMRLARLVQILLYAGMLSTPVLGVLLMQSSGKEVAFLGLALPALIDADKALSHTIKEMHEALGVAMLYLVIMHAGAAVWHHLVRRDNALRRVL
jgi:cytochrome b561